MIRIPQVRVVDEEGAQLGIMPTARALEMAQERGLDLVEVAPMAQPPVARFLDFGQYKYELTKREKENKRRQRSVTFKEVRLSPKIGSGDFETKLHRAIEFLEDGDRIKVTVRFRGRELTHPEIGRNLIARFVERVGEHGVAERAPLLEGKAMHITMASTHKPTPAAGNRGGGQSGSGGQPDTQGGPAPAAGPAAAQGQPPKAAPAAPAAAPATEAENEQPAAPAAGTSEQPAAPAAGTRAAASNGAAAADEPKKQQQPPQRPAPTAAPTAAAPGE